MSDNKPAENKPATPVFDWANLGEMQEAKQGYQRKTTINVEDETPGPIKERIEKSFAQNQPGPDGKVDTKWSLQECGTPEMAKKFLDLARRYAKYRKAGQITVRAGKLDDTATAVRFAAKPFETRESRRLPGSETKQVDAKPAENKPAPKPAENKPAPKPAENKPAPKPAVPAPSFRK